MKKIFIFILSIACLLSFAMATACVMPEKNEEEQKDPSIVLMNGFNAYDDLVLYDLTPTSFTGNWKINKDANYIVEGDGSWRISVTSTGANQPNFKTKATRMKTDITDVSEFGLWVYSEADYEFGIIITAFAGDQIVCSPLQKVVKGENNLVFPINRVLIAQSGKVISDYSISFSGIKSGAVVYLDNFYVKTTTEPIVLKLEVKEVIDAISAFSLNPSRAEVEAVMAKYNALSAEDKLCVSNADMLKAAIEPYYLNDLGQAQAEDPDTLLYYDKPFGEVQVTSVTAGIGSYAYSTEQKYGKEEGSLKVEFTTSSTNWVTLSTSANTLVDAEKLEFYVYNDSEQYKAMCIAWNGPVNPENGLPFYVLAPKEWTKFLVNATDLTDSQVGQNGTIQICGLASMDKEEADYASARSPEGTMYFSSFVKKHSVAKQIELARTGEDANTLYFFDRELGLSQVSTTTTVKEEEVSFELSTEKKFGEEDASLAIKVNNFDFESGQYINWDIAGYQFNAGDYVVFYVYNDTDNDVLDITLGTTHRQRAYKGEWTMVIWSAEDIVATGNWTWLISREYADEDYKGMTYYPTNGTVYVSKAKVYSKDQVYDATTVDDDFEYTIGETTFIGNALVENGAYTPDPNGFNDASFSNPYYMDGALRYVARPKNTQSPFSPKFGGQFKEAYKVEGCYVYVTIKGAVEGQVFMQIFNSKLYSGHIASPSGVLVETLDNGYAVYKFDISQYKDEAKATEFKAFRLGGVELKMPVMSELIITNVVVEGEVIVGGGEVDKPVDVSIASLRTGEDANTLYFFDREPGLSQVSTTATISVEEVSFAISTEKKFGNEAASLAINVNNFEFESGKYINWNIAEYQFNAGDYVVFYVYNDTDNDALDISLGTTHRHRAHKGEWTMVIWKAEDLVSTGNWTWLISREYADEDYKGMTYYPTNGTVYVSKAKVYSKDQVFDATTVADDFEYTIGETTFIGKAFVDNGGYMSDDPAFTSDASFTNPYYVNGALRFFARPSTAQKASSPMFGGQFKETYKVDGCYVYVTIKGAVEGQVFMQIFNSQLLGGHIASPKGVLVETLEDGSAVYKFDVSQYKNEAKATEFKAFRIGCVELKKPVTAELIITNVVVEGETIN